MTNIINSCQNIIEEVFRLDEMTISQFKDEPRSIPGLIATGDYGSFIVNEAIENEIFNVAEWMLTQRPNVRDKYNLKEWQAAVRAAFGPALLRINPNDSSCEGARILKKFIEKNIDEHIASHGIHYRSIGCSLFSDSLDTSFTIGPVIFEPKTAWLERALKDNHISKISHRRINHFLSGHTIRKRKTSMDSIQEESILDVLKKAQMVCTVTINGLAPEAAQKRSIIAARLALTSMSLLWETPSRVLKSMRLTVDYAPHIIQTIPFTLGSRMIGGRRLVGMPHGPKMTEDDWRNITNDAKGFFDLAGKMIACWTSTTAYNKAPPVLRCLSQALYYFWDACQDENDLMSIVKFTAALESLVPGKKANGIRKLANARLGIKDNELIMRNKTLAQLVNFIYSKGRSRTLHGTNPGVLYDWSDARVTSEIFTRYCIVSSMDFLEQNPTVSDSECLLT